MSESPDDKAKREQNYDPSTPRCATCLYFRREPHTKYVEREVEVGRRGRKRKKIVKVPLRKHPVNNPIVDRCSFGNFITRPQGCCDEWRDSNGDRVAKADE